MLSERELRVRKLIENNLSGNDLEETLLYHHSVERKLEAVKMWFQNVETILPDFIQLSFTQTYNTSGKVELLEETISFKSTFVKISAYIDAFFMSGVSTLDAFAHEIRMVYGLGGHHGDLYFRGLPNLLLRNHSDTELNSYLVSVEIKNSSWYKDLNSYRRASTHESIIPIRLSGDLDVLSAEWKKFIIKLPLDPSQRPLSYNSKNFIDIGMEIRDKLQGFISESYNKISNDIETCKTKIIYKPKI